jgi:2-aminoadipate transaminase
VRQDHGGIDLEDLDRVCARERAAGARVKLLYLTPNFQNPAGVLLDAPRRTALVEWAARTGVLVVEDDPYGTLYFDDALAGADTRPVSALDSDGCVVYLSTFSKTLAPGLRIGWMVAPAELTERCEAVKQSLDLLSGTLDQRVVLEALREDLPARLAPRLRETYRERLGVMETALTEALGDDLLWTSPRGGFFLWVRLPAAVDDEALLAEATERGVIFVAGSAFFVDGSGHDHIRLSFSWARPDQIREGARRLARAVAACRASPASAHA